MSNFEVYKNELLRARLRYAIILMALPAILSFSFLDYLLAPNLWFEFFCERVATCFVLCIVLILNRHPGGSRLGTLNLRTTSLANLTTLVIGCCIGYVASRTGGLESPYQAGLNWIAIGSLAFFPAVGRDRFVTIGTIYLPLLVFEITIEPHIPGVSGVISLTFLIGTALLSWVINVISLDLMQQEFQSRFKLQDLVGHQERVISVKSEEAANLKRLTKQFSPAVIEAIEAKAISLDQRVRRKVAVIFIDVAGSTGRSTSLDYNDYQAALDLFFDLAIKKLLARNITVANFMGDGLMAIANAPYQLADYEQIAFEAGIEIIEETIKRQPTFRELWKDDFHVRVGISSGFANVGFFPNTDFGVYTAIGDSVNLASRLCSSTKSSTLATTKNILLAAQSSVDRGNVELGGTINAFKGFAGHNLEYFIVSPKIDRLEQYIRQSCPLCNSDLRQAADLGDCVLIKCTSCTYSDIQTLVSQAPLKRIA